MMEKKIEEDLKHAVGLRSQHHASAVWALHMQEQFRREYPDVPDAIQHYADEAIRRWGKIALEQAEWASHFEGRVQALSDLLGSDSRPDFGGGTMVVTVEWAARVIACATQPNDAEWVPFGD